MMIGASTLRSGRLLHGEEEDGTENTVKMNSNTREQQDGTFDESLRPRVTSRRGEFSTESANLLSEADTEDMPGYSVPDQMEDLCTRSVASIGENQKTKLKELLQKHEAIFANPKQDTGLTDLVEHRINTREAAPIKQSPHRLPIHQRQEEKEQIADM